MALEIILTSEAKESFKKVIAYLETEWGYEVVFDFLDVFYSKLEILSDYPYIGPKCISDSKYRKLLITKHNMMYYSIIENKIIVHDMLDTRQDPAKNPFE